MIGSQTNILVIALNVRRSFGTVLFELGYSLWRLFAPSRAASSVLRQSKSIGTTEWRRRLTERADSGSRSKSSARAFNTTELPTIAEEIEETSAGHTQYTDSYAFYLSVCLSVVNSRIGTRMRRQRTIRSPIRKDLVSQIRALKAHPFANRKHALALVPFLSFADQEIAAVAAEAFISLSERLSTRVVGATIEWLEDDVIVARFDHPLLGVVEREFHRAALPEGAEQGDRFELAIELDVTGHVCGYRPLRDHELVKKRAEEWESIKRPEPPEDLDDEKAMDLYNDAMREYIRKVLPMRAEAEARGESPPSTD